MVKGIEKRLPLRIPLYQIRVGVMVPLTGLEPVRSCDQGILSPWCLPIPPQRHMIKLWILSPWCLPIPPVAVPGVRLADGAAALHTDRCHSLGSLYLPPAALPSLPTAANKSGVLLAWGHSSTIWENRQEKIVKFRFIERFAERICRGAH